MEELQAKGITAEVLFAAVLGAISLFSGLGLVPVISFWWLFPILMIIALLISDVCWRSHRVIASLAQPWSRLALSTLICTGMAIILWTPMRERYAEEHLQPTFAYITPALWLNDEWEMAITHYGPSPIALDVSIEFQDEMRARLVFTSLPHGKLPPSDALINEGRIFRYPLVDRNAVWPETFFWRPYNQDHEVYFAKIGCQSGTFIERLYIESHEPTFMTLSDYSTGKLISGCSNNPNDTRGFQNCRIYFRQHHGDVILPLTLPTNPDKRRKAFFVWGWAILNLWSLYAILGFFRMDI